MKSESLPTVKARRLIKAIIKCGFEIVRISGSHKFMRHPDGRTLLFAFHDRETIGPRMLPKILKDACIEIREILKVL